jgi:hypothetical protein
MGKKTWKKDRDIVFKDKGGRIIGYFGYRNIEKEIGKRKRMENESEKI